MSVVRKMMSSQDGMKELLGMMTPEEKERMCSNLRSIQKKGNVSLYVLRDLCPGH